MQFTFLVFKRLNFEFWSQSRAETSFYIWVPVPMMLGFRDRTLVEVWEGNRLETRSVCCRVRHDFAATIQIRKT